ncbi:MAG: hypothetical protein GXP43_00800 [bacterium]|nr:hypothetical protein [bacterium]
MKTVGQILKTHRLRQNISLDQVASVTKIKKTFLKAIEDNRFETFDSLAAAQGFIRNYARFLQIDEYQTLAVFKRDFGIDPSGKIAPRDLLNSSLILPQRRFNWLILPFSFVLFVVLALVWYFRWYIFPPPLKIYQPQDVQITAQARIFVKGSTLPYAKVSVNQLTTAADEQGRFEQPIILLPGINQIIIDAAFKNKHTTKTLDVIYRPEK